MDGMDGRVMNGLDRVSQLERMLQSGREEMSMMNRPRKQNVVVSLVVDGSVTDVWLR